MNLNSKNKKNRVFLGTTEIAGYYRNLAKGFDAIGVNYKYVQLSPNTSGFGSQSKLPFLIKLPYLLAKYRLKISVEPGLYSVHKTKKGFRSLLRYFLYFFEYFFRVTAVLPWAIVNFDIFCFGCRSNIIGIKAGFWDIALLKLLGKRIIYIYHGSDSRPPYINGSILQDLLTNYPDWEKILKKKINATKKAVDQISQLADVVIDNPYSAHFQTKPFINWFNIGMPFVGENHAFSSKTSETANPVLRILHAPTHRIAKGSSLIEACITQLQQEGYALELILVHGRPHQEVMEEIQKCDFVIDELYSDVLMAGFAAEASFYAKPVIVCGYIEDEHTKQMIPTYYCKPEKLKSAVLKFIDEPQFRQALGNRARDFVKNEWSYIYIAEKFKKIFLNQIPNDWYFDPKKISYLHGFGMPEGLLKQTLLNLLNKEGVVALQLNDKPHLIDSFLNFAELNAK